MKMNKSEFMKVPSFERSLAVVVGIDAYGNGISTLKTAVSDGRSVAELLKEKLKFDVIWTRFDAEATNQSLIKLIEEELPNEIKANDRLLFYFAGHGIAKTDAEGPQGFLIPQDAKLQNESSWLPMHRFEQALTTLKCRHCLLILDCCFAGAFRWSISTRHLGKGKQVVHKQRFDRFIKDPAWQVITSAAYDQEAIDVLSLYRDQRGSNYGSSHSPFADALLEGLGGKADLSVQGEEGDGIITASELCIYLRNQVEPETQDCQHRQTPELWTLKSHDKGEFVFLTDKFNREDLQEAPRIDEKENPYRGLQSYDETNADLFFGRVDCIEKLREIVVGDEQRFTVVLGASGSGKSSLVKAGLIPALKKTEVGNWECKVIRPGDKPAVILGKALNDLQASKSCQRLLVVDQAEELLTHCRDQVQRDEFLKNLASTLKADKTFHLLFTLRSDFEPQLRDLALKPFWKQQSRYIVPNFKREELKRVIEEPASQKVVRFESDKLVDDLIDEVAQMPGGLPLLSFALSELYLRLARRFLAASQSDTMVDRIITAEDFEAVGGVARSLTLRAEEIYKELKKNGGEMEGSMQRVLLRMVAEGGDMARRRVLRSELEYPGPEAERVGKILNSFEQARLLTSGNDEQERPYVEPAHDALVNGWTRLQNWARDQAPRLSLERQLSRDVEVWQSNRKEKAKPKDARRLLWTEDPRLPQAQAWAFNKPEHHGAVRWSWLWGWLIWTAPGLTTYLFNKHETEFIEASLKERFRRRRNTLGLVIFVGIVLSSIATLALIQRNKAQNQLLRTVSSQATNSGELFDSHKNFNALLTSLSAASNLQQSTGKENPIILSNVRDALLNSFIRRREMNRLEGHQGPVTRVLFSPDGSLVASDSSDNTIRVWEASSGKELMKLDKAKHKVKDIMFIENGQLAYVTGDLGNIRIIDPKSKKEISTSIKEPTKNSAVRLLGNSLLASKDTKSDTVSIWHLATQGIKKRNSFASIQLMGKSIENLNFSKNGKIIYYVSDQWGGNPDKQVTVWMNSGNQMNTFKVTQRGYMTAHSISSNGKFFVFGDEHSSLSIWDPIAGKQIIQYPGDQGRISSLYISEDSSKLISGGWGKMVRIWDLNSRKRLLSLTGHKGSISDAALNSKGNLLATASEDKTIKIWEISSDRPVTSLRSYPVGAGVVFSNDGKLLASTSKARYTNEINTIYLMDTANKKTLATLKGHTHWIKSLSFSPDGKWLASAAWDFTFRLWDVDSCIKKKECEADYVQKYQGKQYVTSVSFSSDGKMLASVANKGWVTPNDVELWNMKTAKTAPLTLELRCVAQGNKDFINNVVFFPESDKLATSSNDKFIRVWSTANCKEVNPGVEMKSPGSVRWVDVSPDGLSLASGGDDQIIRLWDTGSGIMKTQLPGHSGTISAILFGSDSKWLTSLSQDQTIKIWNLEAGKEKYPITLKAHRKPLAQDTYQNLSISKDGNFMASVAESDDGELLFWNLSEIRGASRDTLVKDSCGFIRGYLKNGASVDNRNICDVVISVKGD